METIHMEVAAMIQVTVMIKVMTAVMTKNHHMVHNNHHMVHNNHHMVHNNHHMTNQNILLKALTATTVTTKLRIKNMNVELVHSKAFS